MMMILVVLVAVVVIALVGVVFVAFHDAAVAAFEEMVAVFVVVVGDGKIPVIMYYFHWHIYRM
jgi:hypothetical protein